MGRRGTRVRLHVVSNIPSPYNFHFFGDLSQYLSLRVRYAAEPAAEGREWPLQLHPFELIEANSIAEQREIMASRPDVVLITGSYLGARSVMRRTVGRAAGRSLMFWGERLSANTLPSLAYRRRYFTGMSCILAVGSAAAESYRAVVGDQIPVHNFPYTTGVIETESRPAHTSDRETRREPILGYVGSLTHRKGVDRIFRALGQLRRDQRPRLQIIGEGPDRQQLTELAAHLEVAVEWFGFLDPAARASVQRSWLAQVVPSRYDGWGVVVSEAMGLGIPIIGSTAAGAVQDLVRTGWNGIQVDSLEKLVEAITLYSCHPETAHRHGLNAAALGREVQSAKAAEWLAGVLVTPPSYPRSFVGDAWANVWRSDSFEQN